MRRKIGAALVALPLLALASAASADEPLRLTDGQMDSVTAGALSFAQATGAAAAIGGTVAATATTAFASTLVVGVGPAGSGLTQVLTNAAATAAAAN